MSDLNNTTVEILDTSKVSFFPSLSVSVGQGSGRTSTRVNIELSGDTDADEVVLRKYAKRTGGGFFNMTAFVDEKDLPAAEARAEEIIDTVFSPDGINMQIQKAEPRKEGQSWMVSISPVRENTRTGF